MPTGPLSLLAATRCLAGDTDRAMGKAVFCEGNPAAFGEKKHIENISIESTNGLEAPQNLELLVEDRYRFLFSFRLSDLEVPHKFFLFLLNSLRDDFQETSSKQNRPEESNTHTQAL